MSEKYSLEALRTLRAAREEALDLELAESGRELERRRLELSREQQELERLGAERRKSGELEARALGEGGGLPAAELVLGFEHRLGQVSEEERQRSRVQSSEAEAQRAALERERAGAALRVAQAESEAVERHHQRFLREQARRAEEAEDEAATERWNAQHPTSGRA